MGLTHSVLIAQHVNHVVAFQLVKLPKEVQIVGNSSKRLGLVRYGIYNDNFFIFGKDRELVVKYYNLVFGAFESADLPLKLSKCVSLCQNRVSVLGIVVDHLEELEPFPKKL